MAGMFDEQKKPETWEEWLALAQSMPEDEPDKAGLLGSLTKISELQGEERDKALANLSAAYDMRSANLRDDLELAYNQYTAPSPQAIEGPSGNPFAYTVAASPLEHAASGAMKYMGGKDIKRVRGEREALAKGQEAATDLSLRGMLEQMEKEKREEEERKRLAGLYGGIFGMDEQYSGVPGRTGR